MKKDDLIAPLEEWIVEQRLQEYASSTLERYKANVLKFINWLPDDAELSKELTIEYKAHLAETLGSTNSVNTNIVELNKFLKWLGCGECCVRKVKMQTKSSNEEVLSLTDFQRLLRIAKREHMEWLYYVMKILAMTGIRISELRYFKIENMESNYIKTFNKGKERNIIVRQDLMRELKRYARAQGIKQGYLFPSKVNKGQQITNQWIWKCMKNVAGKARVKKSKVHAHSFRHLFAQIYLETYTGNITQLADILGHNSLETTRVYTKTSDAQKRVQLEQMNFSQKGH